MNERRVLLLVDDDCDDVAVAVRALHRSELRVDVRTARTGEEALQSLHVGPRTQAREALFPRAIFLDLALPRLDGFEVLRALRLAAHTRTIPVVVLSASTRPEDIRLAYDLGANSYLVKRAEIGDPEGLVAEAARYWLELNRVTRAG
jgi:two-component system response regulator